MCVLLGNIRVVAKYVSRDRLGRPPKPVGVPSHCTEQEWAVVVGTVAVNNGEGNMYPNQRAIFFSFWQLPNTPFLALDVDETFLLIGRSINQLDWLKCEIKEFDSPRGIQSINDHR